MIGHYKIASGLAGVLIFLAGCQSDTKISSPTLEKQEDSIISNLPSISELAGAPAPEFQPLPTLDTDEVEKGREIYAENCAECHGVNLEGESDWQQQNEDDSFRSPPHDSSGHTWHHGDISLLESIELGGARLPDYIGGISEMPAFGETLSDNEMIAVLTYIKSTWPDDIRLTQWEQTIQERNQ